MPGAVVALMIPTRRSAVPQKFVRLIAWLLGAPLAGCFTPAPQPIDEPITVRVAAADSTRSIRFALDVTGDEAELRAPRMRGWASDARLTAVTPADITLHPGTTAASLQALGGGQLEVSAAAPRARLWANGTRVRLTSTTAGLSIRDY
jgi:hypothetical protein